MQENLPEIPTVEEIAKNPWSAERKFLWTLIAMFIVYTIYSKREDLPAEERASWANQVAVLNREKYEHLQKDYNDLAEKNRVLEENKALKDSLRIINNKMSVGLMPPARKILK